MGSIHTFRGVIGPNQTIRLMADDGIFTNVVRIKSFEVFGLNHNAIVTGAVLGTSSDMMSPTADFNAGNNQQIAWSGAGTGIHWAVIDPGHLIVQDLWLFNLDPSDMVNYIVVMEREDVSGDVAILAMIKERAQNAQPPSP